MATQQSLHRMAKPAGFLAAATLASWLLLSAASSDHRQLHQEAPEIISRQGYKPFLRARQATSAAPSSGRATATASGAPAAGNSTGTTGGNGSVITLA